MKLNYFMESSIMNFFDIPQFGVAFKFTQFILIYRYTIIINEY